MKPRAAFVRKTYGRIWVRDEEDIKTVRNIIREQDEFELDYLPKDFIAQYNGNVFNLVYGHKFELDLYELTQRCLGHGIWIICITGGEKDLV